MLKHVQVPDPSCSKTANSGQSKNSLISNVAEHRQTAAAESAMAVMEESDVSEALPPGELPSVSALEMAELHSMGSHSSDRGETGSSESGDEAPATESADECADEDVYVNLSVASDKKPQSQPLDVVAAANSGASPARLSRSSLSDFLVVDTNGGLLPTNAPHLLESSLEPKDRKSVV